MDKILVFRAINDTGYNWFVEKGDRKVKGTMENIDDSNYLRAKIFRILISKKPIRTMKHLEDFLATEVKSLPF